MRILDGLEFSAEEEMQVEQGAIAAFERFNVLRQHAYTNAPTPKIA